MGLEQLAEAPANFWNRDCRTKWLEKKLKIDILSCVQKKKNNTQKTCKLKRLKNFGLAAPSASKMICGAASLLCCSPLTFVAPPVVFFILHLMFPKLNGGSVAAEVASLPLTGPTVQLCLF